MKWQAEPSSYKNWQRAFWRSAGSALSFPPKVCWMFAPVFKLRRVVLLVPPWRACLENSDFVTTYGSPLSMIAMPGLS